MSKKKATPMVRVGFAAIDKVLQVPMLSPDESKVGERITWGKDDKYPSWLYRLYKRAPTLRSVIDGSIGFIMGDGFTDEADPRVNADGLRLSEVIESLALDLLLYNGCALEVIRSRGGESVHLYPLAFSDCRTDKDRGVVYYSPDGWPTYKRSEIKTFPIYRPDVPDVAAVLYYVGPNTREVYPSPTWETAIEACAVEAAMGRYHVNSLENGFTSNYIVSFNNGVPSDEAQAQIEKNFTEKFTGTENAGRVMLSYNDDKEHATEIVKIPTDDFPAKYEKSTTWSERTIFTAFHASPSLFGIPSEGLGFNSQEYAAQYWLYSRQIVNPARKALKRIIAPFYAFEFIDADMSALTSNAK